MEKVVPLRALFRKDQDVQARRQIASEEFDAWSGYLKARKEHIAAECEDFHIDEHCRKIMKEQYDRLKDRKTLGIYS